MSKFGIRKRLKGLVKQALGVEETPPPAPPAAYKPPPPPAPKPPAPKPPPVAAPPAPEPERPPDEGGTMWVQAGKAGADEIIPGSVHQVEVFGKRYAVYKVDGGEFFASADACPHAGGPLGEGDLDGHTITCPFHSFEFDVKTGECKSGAELSLRCVNVKVKKNRVLLEVTP